MCEEIVLLAQTIPTFGAYDLVMLAARFLHVASAIIIVGGLFYLWAVVTPSPHTTTIDGPTEGAADQFFGGSRAAWARWVGIASLFLIVTGLWNFVSTVTTYKLHFTYHILGLVKILLGLSIMMLAALLAGRTAAAERIRQRWGRWLTITLLLGIITVSVGSIMRTFPRTEKIDRAPSAMPVAE